MSYVPDHTGVPIAAVGYNVVSGADRRWYMFRVPEMMTFLERTFGGPNKATSNPATADFAGMQAVLVARGTGWSNAVGHVTLRSGRTCSDSCHLAQNPDNGTFVPDVARPGTLR